MLNTAIFSYLTVLTAHDIKNKKAATSLTFNPLRLTSCPTRTPVLVPKIRLQEEETTGKDHVWKAVAISNRYHEMLSNQKVIWHGGRYSTSTGPGFKDLQDAVSMGANTRSERGRDLYSYL